MNDTSSIDLEKKGTWFAILSGLFYGLLGYFGVNLVRSGFSVVNVSFWRFSTAFIFLAIVFIFQKNRQAAPVRQSLYAVISGGLFYAAPGNLFLISSHYIGTGPAMVIFFIFPAFVMLLNWAFLRQPIKPHYLLSFLLILSGLVMMADAGEARLDFTGISLSILAALSYATYIFLSKKIAALPALNSSSMVSLGCAITCGALAVSDGSLTLPTHFEQWLHILGLGIICSALPILFLFEALKHISADKAALLSVLEPVFVVVFGVLLLNEALSFTAVIGIALTLTGAVSVSVNWKATLFKFKQV